MKQEKQEGIAGAVMCIYHKSFFTQEAVTVEGHAVYEATNSYCSYTKIRTLYQ